MIDDSRGEAVIKNHGLFLFVREICKDYYEKEVM